MKRGSGTCEICRMPCTPLATPDLGGHGTMPEGAGGLGGTIGGTGEGGGDVCAGAGGGGSVGDPRQSQGWFLMRIEKSGDG